MQTLIWVKLFKTGKNYPSSSPPVRTNHLNQMRRAPGEIERKQWKYF